MCCDLLKIHYLCGNKDNANSSHNLGSHVVICSKFITFAVTKTTCNVKDTMNVGCDLLKIHYLCGKQRQHSEAEGTEAEVVICSKFITFAVTKTTGHERNTEQIQL